MESAPSPRPALARSSVTGGEGLLGFVNVNQRIVNDADSGVAGNYWAFDKYKRHITVSQTAPSAYCAILRYDGELTTVAGPSPQNTGTVATGHPGQLQGRLPGNVYRQLRADEAHFGGLGRFDYACVLSSNNTVATCPGYQDWLTFYFSSTSGFVETWWGWIYTTEANGTWVNAITGNLGDITGVPPSDQNGDNQNGNHQNDNHQSQNP